MTAQLLETRQRLEAQIEQLISLLDLLDGDPDLESDNDNEPWLGWPANGPSALRCSSGEEDREVEDENDEDGGDIEQDGDEQDYSGDEGDRSVGRLDGGSGL